jgi:perosamine synthetase
MFEYVAPAGAPIRLTDLVRWARSGLSGRGAADSLQQHLCGRFGVRHAFPTITGRAGLTLLLRAMRRLAPPERVEVVLPSYTCYSVAASVVKAGLHPRLLDVAPETLDYEGRLHDGADYSRTLAVIATNLYGLPNDLPALEQFSRRHGLFLIDDAAQALGASMAGRWSGTWGDAGLFSFDKGKNVAAIDGGVVVTSRDDLAEAFTRELAAAACPPRIDSAVRVFKAVAYALMLHPSLYGVPARIPQLGLGRTVFTTEFELSRIDPLLARLALTMMSRLDDFTARRLANATALGEGISALPGIRGIRPLAGAAPVYVRLPVLFETTSSRDAAVRALNHAGIGATASYPASLADVPELRSLLGATEGLASGGRLVAARIATLPTHPYVSEKAIARTLAVLRGCLLPSASAHQVAAAG